MGQARRLLLFAAALVLPLCPLARAEGADLVRGPYLQALLDTSVEVVWLSGAPSLGKVSYWREGGVLAEVEEASAGTVHRIKLTGLVPGSTYHYLLRDGGDLFQEEFYRFRTAPGDPAEAVRVAVVGDSGIGDADQYAVAAIIRSMAPDLFLHTGDLFYLANVDDALFRVYGDTLAGAGFYPSRGNHDIHFPWRELFYPPMENPAGTGTYYSFDWGSAHFVALDTNEENPGGFVVDGPQLQWLTADLTAARAAGRSWLILYFHVPVYTVGAYIKEALPLRPRIQPIIDRFQVDLVVTGHDHNYQRSHPVNGEGRGGPHAGLVRDAWQTPSFVSPRGTIYVVTGGGGGLLYGRGADGDHRFNRKYAMEYHALEMVITASVISVRALSPDPNAIKGAARVLDEFSISKAGQRPPFEFLRGDANRSGELDVADATVMLDQLFLGGRAPVCPAVVDVEGAGKPNITGVIRLLNYLFLGGPQPPAPFPVCGRADEAEDGFCLSAGCGP
jgi:hypothetical protein